jgi:hypothetical protein
MNKPDWKDAPQDATNWAPETEDRHESWYKKDGDAWACVAVDSYRVFKSRWFYLGAQTPRIDMEPRP